MTRNNICYNVSLAIGKNIHNQAVEDSKIVSQISIQHALEQAQQHCQDRGSRLTEKRRQVLAGLLSSNKALSAYELVDFCRKDQGAELLPMTVYRILDFLEEEGLVHRLDLANKYVACAHIVCRHEHEVSQFLICKTCHRVKEIAIPRSLISTLADSAEAAGFQLARHHLELDCVCHRCADDVHRES